MNAHVDPEKVAAADAAASQSRPHPLLDLEPQICDLVRMAQVVHHYALEHEDEPDLILFVAARMLDMADQLKADFYTKLEEGWQR